MAIRLHARYGNSGICPRKTDVPRVPVYRKCICAATVMGIVDLFPRVVIDKGEVAESGTHDELMRLQDGVYRSLNNLQFQDSPSTLE